MIDKLPVELFAKITEDLTFVETIGIIINKSTRYLVTQTNKTVDVRHFDNSILPRLIQMHNKYNLAYNITYTSKEPISADIAHIRIDHAELHYPVDTPLTANSIKIRFGIEIELINQYTTKSLSITSNGLYYRNVFSVYMLSVAPDSNLASQLESLEAYCVNIDSLAHCKKLKKLRLMGVNNSGNTDALLQTHLTSLILDEIKDTEYRCIIGSKFDKLVRNLKSLELNIFYSVGIFDLLESALIDRSKPIDLSISIHHEITNAVFSEARCYPGISKHLNTLYICSNRNTRNVLLSFSSLQNLREVSAKCIRFESRQINSIDMYAGALQRYVNLEMLYLHSVENIMMVPNLPKLKDLGMFSYGELDCDQGYSISNISANLESLSLNPTDMPFDECYADLLMGVKLKSLNISMKCVDAVIKDSICSLMYLSVKLYSYVDLCNFGRLLSNAVQLRSLSITTDIVDEDAVFRIGSDMLPNKLEELCLEFEYSIELEDLRHDRLRTFRINTTKALNINGLNLLNVETIELKCLKESTMLGFTNYANLANLELDCIKIDCLDVILKQCKLESLLLWSSEYELTEEMAEDIIRQPRLNRLTLHNSNYPAAKKVLSSGKHICVYAHNSSS